MNQKQKIIIAYYRKKKSQRIIARELGLNRRMVARYIKDYERKRNHLLVDEDNSRKEEIIGDIVESSSYDTNSRKKVKLTKEIMDIIYFYLQENEQKKKNDIYKVLQEEGFAIGYTTICYTIREIQQEYREAYIR